MRTNRQHLTGQTRTLCTIRSALLYSILHVLLTLRSNIALLMEGADIAARSNNLLSKHHIRDRMQCMYCMYVLYVLHLHTYIDTNTLIECGCDICDHVSQTSNAAAAGERQ